MTMTLGTRPGNDLTLDAFDSQLPGRAGSPWQAAVLLRLIPAMAAEAAAAGLPSLNIDVAGLSDASSGALSTFGRTRIALTGHTPGSSARAPWLVQLVKSIEILGLQASFVPGEGQSTKLKLAWSESRFPELAQGEEGRTKLFAHAMRLRVAAAVGEAPSQSVGAASRLFGPIVEEYLAQEMPKLKERCFGDLPNTELSPLIDEGIKKRFPDLLERCLEETRRLALERLAEIPPQCIKIVDEAKVILSLPRQHYLFGTVLQMLQARDGAGAPLSIALVGPAGTGKTCMAMNAAKALQEDFVLQPFSPQTTKSELSGYMDATGRYVESPFYKAFKNGMLFIADEFDAANPAVAVILNAAVSNRVMTFPNGETVSAHENFRAIFAMNTYGTGGDDRYTGRSRLDAATLDRMVFLQVPIDPGLEAALVGIPDVSSPSLNPSQGQRFTSEREILHEIVSIRGGIEREHLRYTVSPRATIHACALHRAGFAKEFILECCVWRGMPASERARITGPQDGT